MRPSSPESLADQVATCARRGPLGLLFDYDGTLVEIAPRPEDARLSLPVRRRLEALSERADVRVAAGAVRIVEGKALLELQPAIACAAPCASSPAVSPSSTHRGSSTAT